MRNRDYSDIMKLNPDELKKRQKRRGWALYFIGWLVYKVLIILKFKPDNFYGICPYFEIGTDWGGLEMGWFFICGKNSSDDLKSHEVGHGIQNASKGGIIMLFLCLCSAIRYWKRRIFGYKTPYDSWWFEGQATTWGKKYVNLHK